MKRYILIILAAALSIAAAARDVSISAHAQPASEVFRSLMEQTGKNFVYSSEILSGMKVTIEAKNQPLEKVLRKMFEGTGIEYKIKGNNVLLKRTKKKNPPCRKPEPAKKETNVALPEAYLKAEPVELEEVVVVSRLEAPQVESAEIGAGKFTPADIVNTPVIFSEPDVMKTLHKEPGITEGLEGFAGMYVHGGNGDENLCMFDNVPLYNVNHFGGLFSAFNVDAIKYIDFFKTSMPAKYDGRLSSFLDVRTRNGSREGHHGSAKLGLTSGAFSIGGPIGKKTTYNVALRRSWYDVLTAPLFAIISSITNETYRIRYDFIDLNAKINHSFNSRTSSFISFYFGNDEFHGKDTWDKDYYSGVQSDDKYDLNWGNIMAQTGVVHRFSDEMTGEFTGAYVHYFSQLKSREREIYVENGEVSSTVESLQKTSNFIDDGILRADFTWNPADNSCVRFGGGYTLHSFQPIKTMRQYEIEDMKVTSRDSLSRYIASEFNAYVEDDWHIYGPFRANAGLHLSMFHIEGRDKFGVSPRLSVSYRPHDNWAIKGAFSRT
ncbi:MAG: TonB-dependent receptor, partial [Muribaculaceae bacterium]|nr:TonB-dependent receptor [Muribaculaceae bacterium]